MTPRKVLGVGITVLLGWLCGLVAGALTSPTPATAQTCPLEAALDFSNANQTIDDNDDGQIEENQWFFHGGNDTGFSLGCDDIDVNGQDDMDEVGGGSGRDNVSGGLNSDDVFGGTDNDNLSGGDGPDIVEDVQSNDFDDADGNANQDEIDVRDGDAFDTVDGGTATDVCLSNTGDTEVNCP